MHNKSRERLAQIAASCGLTNARELEHVISILDKALQGEWTHESYDKNIIGTLFEDFFGITAENDTEVLVHKGGRTETSRSARYHTFLGRMLD